MWNSSDVYSSSGRPSRTATLVPTVHSLGSGLPYARGTTVSPSQLGNGDKSTHDDKAQLVQIIWLDSQTTSGKMRDKYRALLNQNNAVAASDLIDTATKAKRAMENNRNKCKTSFEHIATWLHRHDKAIDVATQMNPVILRAVRILMEAAVDGEEASEVTANGLLLITQHVEIWDKMISISGNKSLVEDATTALYVQVLGFLILAVEWYERKTLGE
ncbi:hypothetical protein QQS21_004366 [Conoideocrella luteorostrata]|uniref:Uncharacterized protein n=1 Tax=Conoideocrella luteorostrata TaxID=1105319 RepID=A0AAJ0FZW0_9HYPO|nr:hypothetical protein QQS21_004366 [Conoideocrella luteorostrata]